jgi:radical SAM protein with 4Fe4S-binding SPASM domain
MVHDLNLDFLKVHDYQPIGKEFDNQAPSLEPERVNSFFDEAETLAKELGVDLILPPKYTTAEGPRPSGQGRGLLKGRRLFPKRGRFPQRCILPWKYTQIRLGGEVTPCCQSSRLMGMLEKSPFAEIWNNRRYRFFRWRIDTFFPPPECRECHVYEGINKGNATNTMSEEGLLLRLAYSLEKRISEWLEKRKQLEKPQPEPTYFQGKKWKGKNNDAPRGDLRRKV